MSRPEPLHCFICVWFDQVHVTWCPFQLDDQPTKPYIQQATSGLPRSHQALAWWRNLWKLAISLQSSQGTGTSGVWGQPFRVRRGPWDSFQKGILLWMEFWFNVVFFFWTLKTPISWICFRNFEHQNYAIHFTRSPMICRHFTGLSLPPPRGNKATTLSTS